MHDSQVANERASAFEMFVASCAMELGMVQVNVSIWICKRMIQKIPRHPVHMLTVSPVTKQRFERVFTCTAVKVGVQGVRKQVLVFFLS